MGWGTPIVMQERMESENPNAGPNEKGWSDDNVAFTLEARHRPQTVAFDCKQSGQGGEVAPPLRAIVHFPTGVRRLTPRECERLQGFPTCIQRVIIEVCLDHQNGDVSAALKCLRSQSNVLPAEGGENTATALSADATLWNDQESRESLVAVHVRLLHAPTVLAIRSRGKFLWSANGAGEQSWYLPHTQPAAFAHAIAAVVHLADKEVQAGKVESQQPIRRFSPAESGKVFAAMFGRESVEDVSGAVNMLIAAMKSTIFDHGRDIQGEGLTLQTWHSSALLAISLCIPKGTRPASSFKITLDLETDFTAIDYRGKPAKDGPRYKAIGNSMAVPVMHWIGLRIMEVEALG